jgi:Concanavalin A-like lectin/glucanases superfamily
MNMPVQNAQQGPVQLPEAVTNTVGTIGEGISNAYNNVSESVGNASNYVKESIDSFAKPEDSTESYLDEFKRNFLESNSLVAKFAFLVIVLILFIFFFNVGIKLVGHFTRASSSPFLISGTMNGSTEIVIPQDPKNKNTISILRSNNRMTGIEFTWCLWLYLNDFKYDDVPQCKTIFNKGNGEYDESTGIATVNNGPGLYLDTSSKKRGQKLAIVMNTVSVDNPVETVYVHDIPIRKWFHCAIRMENKVIDIYVNGVIVGRHVLQDVPKQNYQDVNICKNGGFNGNLADLQYFDRALSIFEINNVVAWGRNTRAANSSSKADGTGFPYFLSRLWYNQN